MNSFSIFKVSSILLIALFLAGCESEKSYTYTAPDGTRHEYKRSELEVMDNGETHYRRAPQTVNVWRTRPGPETGPNSHELINSDYTGYESSDIPVLEKEMGMTPGINQWPHNQVAPCTNSQVASYWQNQQYASTEKTHKSPPKTAKSSRNKNKSIAKSQTPEADRDGFRSDGPGWMRESYGANTGLADWIKSRLGK